MAEQILRDPYNFDFLTLTKPFAERELEKGLLAHLRDLLLELGRGFAFIGSQVPLLVDGRSFYVDLLFYHVRLHCYFAIELKTGEFQPEYAGKLGFYIAAIDGSLRTAGDAPTIGLLLCESRSGPIVEYALQNLLQPIGVSTYRVTRELPAPVREELPSVEDLQQVVIKLRTETESTPGLQMSSAGLDPSDHPPGVNLAIAYCQIAGAAFPVSELRIGTTPGEEILEHAPVSESLPLRWHTKRLCRLSLVRRKGELIRGSPN